MLFSGLHASFLKIGSVPTTKSTIAASDSSSAYCDSLVPLPRAHHHTSVPIEKYASRTNVGVAWIHTSFLAEQRDQAPIEEREAHALTAVDEEQLGEFTVLLIKER